MMAPGEGDALLRYSPLFVPDAQAAIERAHSEGLTVSISGVELQSSGSGDRRTLTPESFVIEGTVPSTWGFVAYADPTLPTVIYSDAGGFAIVPAGEPIPATIDELVLLSEDPDGVLQGAYNTTYAWPDGTIEPIEFSTARRKDHSRSESSGATVAPISPVPASSGCSRGSNVGRTGRYNYSAVDGGHRVCGGSTPFGGAIFSCVLRGRVPDGVAEHLGRRVGRPVVRLADRDDRRFSRRTVPVAARRCEPDRHTPRGRVLVLRDGPTGDGLDARGRLDDPNGVRDRRRGRCRRSPGGDPRSSRSARSVPARSPVQRPLRQRQRQRQLSASRDGRGRRSPPRPPLHRRTSAGG